MEETSTRRRRCRRSRGAGFTLLEVVFATGLLGFALLSLFMLHNVAIGSNKHASRLSTCMMLAQKQMEYLLGIPLAVSAEPSGDLAITSSDPTTTDDPYAFFAHPSGTAGTTPDPVNAYGNTDATLGPLSYYVTWDVSYPFDGDTTILQIKVRVIFYDKNTGKPHGVTISSFKYRDSYGTSDTTSSSESSGSKSGSGTQGQN